MFKPLPLPEGRAIAAAWAKQNSYEYDVILFLLTGQFENRYFEGLPHAVSLVKKAMDRSRGNPSSAGAAAAPAHDKPKTGTT